MKEGLFSSGTLRKATKLFSTFLLGIALSQSPANASESEDAVEQSNSKSQSSGQLVEKFRRGEGSESDVPGEISVSFGEVVQKSDRYEPDRIYPIEHNIPGIAGLYKVEGGKISFITEKDLAKKLEKVVVRRDANFFTTKDGKEQISYVMQKPTILDPEIGGGKDIHWGADIYTASPEKATILTSMFRSKFREWVAFRRIGPHGLVAQLVDAQGGDIVMSLGGEDYLVFAIYGHVRDLGLADKKDGDIIEVGDVIGDLSRDPFPESGPHTHMELLMISKAKHDKAMGEKGLISLLTHEEYSTRVDNAYLDSTIFFKFMPGDMNRNTGRSKSYFEATRSLKARSSIHAK